MNDKKFIIETMTEKTVEEWQKNNEALKKDGRGGVRVAGPGKSLGRSPIPDDQRRGKHTIVLGPGYKELAQEIARQKGYKGWGYAVEEALDLLAKEMGIK